MIDLHCHILPGIDDGAPDMDCSLSMARTAVRDGIRTIVATPHVSYDYPPDPGRIGQGVGALNVALAREEIPLAVLPGAEVSFATLGDLSDDDLRTLSLGGGPYLLIEAPYSRAAIFLDELLFELELRGFSPLLAHPERSAIFQDDPGRLRRLVERGVLCSINAGSMAGHFGSTVRRFTLQLLREGLVHNVASDAHDDARRAPVLSVGFQGAEPDVPGLSGQGRWLTDTVPAAILSGEPVPARPAAPAAAPSRWRRLIGRR